ncbi:MAG: isoprenylcysteine carboxylmethyltransferase family protein [Gammaproteobacteria bacterium]|nr:isoprenylcysteine carboxylmethyltransferase family protein [Gammaproteobacteria bacterium]
MDDFILQLKLIVVFSFYAVLLGSIFIYNAYVRRNNNEGVSGSLHFEEIPKGMRWMPVLASVAGLYIIGYSLLFLIDPDTQNHYFPVLAMQDTRISILGMSLVVIGMGIFLSCQFQLGRSYRLNFPSEKTRLITSGLYSISRNPLYIGLYMAFFGVFLMLPNWLYFFSLLFFIFNYHFKIKILEEKFLLEQFGDEYRDYCSRVRRYL